ncbi:MAG: hypothetical protein ACYTXE_33730 [Nostoc sp.]
MFHLLIVLGLGFFEFLADFDKKSLLSTAVLGVHFALSFIPCFWGAVIGIATLLIRPSVTVAAIGLGFTAGVSGKLLVQKGE